MPDIEIDGQTYSVAAGGNLLQACLSLGLDLPYFCWHPGLGSVGACRQCAVMVYQKPEDTRGRLAMACMTPVAEEGLRVALRHPEARRFRADIVELLMTNHPHDCPVCEEGGECHLQDMTVMTGHTSRRYRGLKRTHRNQNLGPFINHEMNRCIACYRCVRYYQDYCGGRDLQVFAAHNHVYFGRHEDGALESEFAGNLVEVCPTGVFTDKPFSQHYARKWDLQTAPSVCVHCGLGCNTSPGERYGTLRRVVNRYHGEVNGYFLCDRGRFGYGFVNSTGRIRKPLIQGQPASREDALDKLAALLGQSRRVIGIGSPRASLEANFALRRLVGVENFYAGFSALESRSIGTIVDVVKNSPVRIASLRDVEQADAVLMVGEDVSNTAPRLALALRQAVRNRSFELAGKARIPPWQDAAVREAGQEARSPLFVLSPAETRLDDVAARTLRGAPEELARVGFAVARELNAEAPEVADLDAERLELAAEIAIALRAARRPLVVSGAGSQSEALLQAAAQVAWALAALRGVPTDVHFATPECNSLGLGLMEGGELADAFAAVEAGRADTLIVLENDLYRRGARPTVDRVLGSAGHVVVVDHLLHDTVRRAELVLPGSSFAETEGTLVSSEGRAQRFFAVMACGNGVQDSWRWLSEAAQSGWRSIDEATAACARMLPVFLPILLAAPDAGFRVEGQKVPRQPHRYSGRTAMLADVSIREPQPPADPDSALAFSMEGAAAEIPPALLPSVWAPGWNSNQAVNKFQAEIAGHLAGGDPGVRLIEPKAGTAFRWFGAIPSAPQPQNGQWRVVLLHHVFGSEELSLHAPPIAERAPAPYVALNPQDGALLGLQEGELLEATLGDATLRLPLRMLDSLARGLAGLPVGLAGVPWVDAPAMRLEVSLPGQGGGRS